MNKLLVFLVVAMAGGLVCAQGNAQQLFHTQTNLRYGCTVFRHFLDQEKGDLHNAIVDYVANSYGVVSNSNSNMVTVSTRRVLDASTYWQ